MSRGEGVGGAVGLEPDGAVQPPFHMSTDRHRGLWEGPREGEGAGPRHTSHLDCDLFFSRWCWLIPIPDRGEQGVATALLERVFLDLGMFPTVLRTDRAKEFTGNLIAYINSQLEIRHVLGSSYHPQSQGIVERLHRTMKMVCTGLLENFGDGWPRLLTLRAVRSPEQAFEVPWRTATLRSSYGAEAAVARGNA